MTYKVEFIEEAIRSLAKLDREITRRIHRKLIWLAENAKKIEHAGLRGDLAGKMKLREGDYRVIYEVLQDEELNKVRFIGHRSEVYKRR